MKIRIATIIMLSVFCQEAYAQTEYFKKVEIGYSKYQYSIIQVDPGPGWKGYYLNKEQNGINLNLVYGINFNTKLLVGVGIGYINFENINGYSIFSNFEYIPLKTKLSPLININFGYNHIYNQYDKGTRTLLLELDGGLNYKITEKTNIYIKSGLLINQKALLIPVNIGIRF